MRIRVRQELASLSLTEIRDLEVYPQHHSTIPKGYQPTKETTWVPAMMILAKDSRNLNHNDRVVHRSPNISRGISLKDLAHGPSKPSCPLAGKKNCVCKTLIVDKYAEKT